MKQNQEINIEEGERNEAVQEVESVKLQEIQLQHLDLPNTQKGSNNFQNIQERIYHNLSLEELKLRFQTDFEKGLTTQQVKERQRLFGDNVISVKPVSFILKIIKSNMNLYTLFFLICSVICFIIYGLNENDTQNIYIGFLIIIFVFTINLMIAISYSKYLELISSVQNENVKKCDVIRDNKQQLVEQKDLVIGDIIPIHSGQKIPADLRIIESFLMNANQEQITGELDELSKSIYNKGNLSFLEAQNILFANTYCSSGQGKGVVVSTGNNTIIGLLSDIQSNYLIPFLIHDNIIYGLINKYLIGCVFVSTTFFLLSYLQMGLSQYESIAFGVAIFVSNVPISLLLNHFISLYQTCQNLKNKNILLKNEKVLYEMGNFTTILTDKTGILTKKNLNVAYLYYNGSIFKNKNTMILGEFEEFNIMDEGFRNLWFSALVCNNAYFNKDQQDNKTNFDYENCQILGGDISDQGILRFIQSIQDVEKSRERVFVGKNFSGSNANIPFTNTYKMSAVFIEEETQNSHITMYIKGPLTKIWQYSQYIQIDGERVLKDQIWQDKFKKDTEYLDKFGIRQIAYGKCQLPKDQYPRGSTINQYSFNDLPLDCFQLTFCGFLALMEEPKEKSPQTISYLRSINIKTVMATQEYGPCAVTLARLLNIFPKNVLTNEDIYHQTQSKYEEWENITKNADCVTINGHQLEQFNCELDNSFNESKQKEADNRYQLKQLLKKPYIIFTRLLNDQKYRIAKTLQSCREIVAGFGSSFTDQEILKNSDIKISMSDAQNERVNELSDIIMLDNNFSSVVEIIEEGRKAQDNLLKAFSYLISSNMVEILSFLSFVILEIPLPLSSFQYIIISLTDSLSAISYAYEQPEIDIKARVKCNKKPFSFPIQLMLFQYFCIGFISCCAGFIGYFTTFNYYGFPVKSLFGLAKISGYKPPVGDFNQYLNQNSNEYNPYFNQNLINISIDCTQNSDKTDELRFDIDWFDRNHAKYDLRKVFLKCDELTKRWVSEINWSYCDVNSDSNQSPVTNQTICYSTEAIYYAQSSFFICIMFFQWVKLYINSTRYSTFLTCPFNIKQLIIMLVELFIFIILLYVPGVQEVFGGRPIHFWQFGIPSFNLIMFYALFEELKKFLLRKYKWIFKYFSY